MEDKIAPPYRIRLYEPGDEHQIVRLFHEVYGKSLSVEQWQWKYLGQGNLRVWSAVAFNNTGEMIAHYGGLPVRMIFKGRHIVGCQCVDAMVKSGYRAKDLGISQAESIFYRLGSLLYKTFGTFFYAFPGDVYYNWGRKTGHIEECLTVNDYRLSKEAIGNKRGMLTSFVELTWQDDGIDCLWIRLKDKIGWAMVRDREFIHWRYESNPFYRHRIFGFKNAFTGRLKGWFVVRDSPDALMIMDALFEDSQLEFMPSFISKLMQECQRDLVRLWLPDRYRERLLSIGFKSVDIHTWMPNFIAYKVADSEEIKRNFYYTMGDTDFL